MPLNPYAMLAPAALNTGVGIWQLIQANKLGKTERPDYQIAPELENLMDRTKSLATMRRLPSESLVMDRLRGSTASAANSIKDISTGGEGLGALANLYSGEQRKLTDLGIAGENSWMNRQNELSRVQQLMGNEQNKEWAWNTGDPYLAKMEAASKMLSGGLQNIAGGVGMGAKSAQSLYNDNPDWLSNIFGGGGTTPPPGGGGTTPFTGTPMPSPFGLTGYTLDNFLGR